MELPRDKAITLSIFSAKFMPSAPRRRQQQYFHCATGRKAIIVRRALSWRLGYKADKDLGADFRRGKGFTVCPANWSGCFPSRMLNTTGNGFLREATRSC